MTTASTPCFTQFQAIMAARSCPACRVIPSPPQRCKRLTKKETWKTVNK